MKRSLLIWVLPVLAGMLGAAVWADTSKNIFVGISSDRAVYKNDQAIALAITVLNTGKRALTIQMPNSQVYDFYLMNHKDEIIWKWSSDKMFAMSIVHYKLEPGKPVTYVVQVTPTFSGKPLEAGEYKLVAVFCTKEKVKSNPLAIKISG